MIIMNKFSMTTGLNNLLLCQSVISKEFIMNRDFKSVIVDDNFLDDEEANSLISAFKNTGSVNFN